MPDSSISMLDSHKFAAALRPPSRTHPTEASNPIVKTAKFANKLHSRGKGKLTVVGLLYSTITHFSDQVVRYYNLVLFFSFFFIQTKTFQLHAVWVCMLLAWYIHIFECVNAAYAFERQEKSRQLTIFWFKVNKSKGKKKQSAAIEIVNYHMPIICIIQRYACHVCTAAIAVPNWLWRGSLFVFIAFVFMVFAAWITLVLGFSFESII